MWMSDKRKVECLGVTNRIVTTEGEMYVMFLDYDNITFQKLNMEIQKIMNKWDLGWTYIIKSNDDDLHWHVICPTIITPYDYLGILWDSSCDLPYKKSFFTLREKTLRISEKKDDRKNKFPELHALFEADSDKPYSTGHIKFLQKYYKAKVPICERYIETPIEYVQYKTSHLNGDTDSKS